VDLRRVGILGGPKRVGPAAALVVPEFRGRRCRCSILEREIADALGKLATGELKTEARSGHQHGL
jgi:hypothetical protein